MSKEHSDRAKMHDELLAEAQKMPGIAMVMDILARWQELETVRKNVQAAEPQMVIVSAANTCG